MKAYSFQWRILMTVTVVNVLIATGYSVAGIIAPQNILPPGAVPTDASFIFSLYAAARTIPLAVIVVYAVLSRNKNAVMILGILAGCIQFADGFIGIHQHDIMKTAGPFFLALIQFSVLAWVRKNDKLMM